MAIQKIFMVFKKFNNFTRESVTFVELIFENIYQVHEMKKNTYFIIRSCFEFVNEESPQIS